MEKKACLLYFSFISVNKTDLTIYPAISDSPIMQYERLFA